jgi:hypothetical protein
MHTPIGQAEAQLVSIIAAVTLLPITLSMFGPVLDGINVFRIVEGENDGDVSLFVAGGLLGGIVRYDRALDTSFIYQYRWNRTGSLVTCAALILAVTSLTLQCQFQSARKNSRDCTQRGYTA